MKLNQKISILILSLSLSYSSFAQEAKNNIYLGTGDLFFLYSGYSHFKKSIYSQYYLSYERKIKKIHLGFSYAQWHNAWGENDRNDIRLTPPRDIGSLADSIKPHTRTKYRFYDIYLGNKIFKNKRHELSYGLGLSLASGWYNYIKDINTSSPINCIYSVTPLIHHYYFGVCSNAQYSLLLFKEKLKLGLSSRFSYHYKHLPQFTFNVQLGTSF